MAPRNEQERVNDFIDYLFPSMDAQRPDCVAGGQPLWGKVGFVDGFVARALGVEQNNDTKTIAIGRIPVVVAVDQDRKVQVSFALPDDVMNEKISPKTDRWEHRKQRAIALLQNGTISV